jgi:hypothetical protein
MELSHILEAASCAATQEFLNILWNPCSKQPSTGPYPEPDKSSPQVSHSNTKQTGLKIMLKVCIWEVVGSNLGWDTGYSD